MMKILDHLCLTRPDQPLCEATVIFIFKSPRTLVKKCFKDTQNDLKDAKNYQKETEIDTK